MSRLRQPTFLGFTALMLLAACDGDASSIAASERETDASVHAADASESARTEKRDAATAAAKPGSELDAEVRDAATEKLDGASSEEPPRDAGSDAASPANPTRDASAPVRDAQAEAPDAAVDGSVDAAVSCEARLDEAAGDHACLHADSGPFAMIELSATPETAPDASKPHTAFELSWPAADPSHGYLRVRANRVATWAIFSANAEVISVSSQERSLSITRPDQTFCASLPIAALADLDDGQWSIIRLARMGDGPGLFVIEGLVAPSSTECGCEDDAGCADQPEPEQPKECRSSGPCNVDADCCEFCHDGDHCH
jgi:hypothetical protein